MARTMKCWMVCNWARRLLLAQPAGQKPLSHLLLSLLRIGRLRTLIVFRWGSGPFTLLRMVCALLHLIALLILLLIARRWLLCRRICWIGLRWLLIALRRLRGWLIPRRGLLIRRIALRLLIGWIALRGLLIGLVRHLPLDWGLLIEGLIVWGAPGKKVDQCANKMRENNYQYPDKLIILR